MNTLIPTLCLLALPLLPGSSAPQDPVQEHSTMTPRPKITPFLWFDDDAEEAMRFYLSIFPDGEILSESRWGAGGPLPEGTLMSARFALAGQELIVLNGGPTHRLNEAFSLLVDCEDQAEIDRYWDRLVEGGTPTRCGWLTDKYGLTWQVVPRGLVEMLTDPDPAKAARVSAAMMEMQKLDVARLERAHAGR